MADWYVGSVQYAAVAQFAISTVYTVGQIVRQLATPAVNSERCFRCTTAGTSAGAEPTWVLTKGATTTSGTAVFTEVTGNATYNWSAPAARLHTMYTSFAVGGDNIYVAANHAETQTTAISSAGNGTDAAPLNVICVNQAGSVPPVAADLRTTATISTTGASSITYSGVHYWYGVTLQAGSAASTASITLSNGGGPQVFENCGMVLNNTSASSRLVVTGTAVRVETQFLNVPVTFGSTSQAILKNEGTFLWRNTASAIVGSVPTSLFIAPTDTGRITLAGLDLSAAGVGKTLFAASSVPTLTSIVNCKLGASVTVAATPTGRVGAKVDLITSDSTSSTDRQERYWYEGTLTREATIIRTGGASNGVAGLSWKVATTANSKWAYPFEAFPIAIWNATVGSPVTATIEIVNDGLTLTDADILVEFQTLDTSGFPISTLHSTGSATILTTGANLPTSSTTWTTTGLGSPVKQYIAATFTPNLAGPIRAVVKVARPSTTVYIDPKLTLS